YFLGWAQDDLGQHEASARTLSDAALAAHEGRADVIAARAWIRLSFEAGSKNHREDEQRWLAFAEATNARLGGNDEILGDLEVLRAIRAKAEGRYREGVEHDVKAVDYHERAYGTEHPLTALIRN